MSKPQVTLMPEQESRVESGPIQFGSDWPGIFLRGDCALTYGMYLSTALRSLQSGEKPGPISLHMLQDLANILSGCDARDHAEPEFSEEKS